MKMNTEAFFFLFDLLLSFLKKGPAPETAASQTPSPFPVSPSKTPEIKRERDIMS